MSLAALFLAATLVIHPVLDEATPVRLVATGTGDDAVVWVVDGQTVGETQDAQPLNLSLGAGDHEVRATTKNEGTWRVLVRPDPPPGTGATYVEGWSAEHRPLSLGGSTGGGFQASYLVLAAAGLALLLWPRRRTCALADDAEEEPAT